MDMLILAFGQLLVLILAVHNSHAICHTQPPIGTSLTLLLENYGSGDLGASDHTCSVEQHVAWFRVALMRTDDSLAPTHPAGYNSHLSEMRITGILHLGTLECKILVSSVISCGGR